MLERLLLDAAEGASFPRYGALRSVRNSTGTLVDLQGFLPETGRWHRLLSGLEPGAEAPLMWLPRHMMLRSVDGATGAQVALHGPVGSGASVVVSSQEEVHTAT
jgi:hypothetical protein